MSFFLLEEIMYFQNSFILNKLKLIVQKTYSFNLIQEISRI